MAKKGTSSKGTERPKAVAKSTSTKKKKEPSFGMIIEKISKVKPPKKTKK
ncbi:hypothetical protein M2459_002277 [Parabacteroides sp. PF5-5]|nr:MULTISPECIES: hypothetical protein [unclassified Parabacteroides]MDH6305180.1 hypothetical protein [Parabacteroides sp. PH5-39]MDH6316530.1 hypothetical protein [Parabacteroides sp. PF5-13]MDH6320040.1 hypothetical protein [Parabacteroides sp. PH5-13]MDH6323727.1 hypothetical protein [Parabacteroides sp. PH5-8]MDH6327717.1 hypothetical protein [Parabacteroides sp. PH5-41]